MTSKAEEIANRCLGSILAPLSVGASIEPSKEFDEFLGALEQIVPAVLRENHPFWRHESLDGFRLAIARKSAPSEVELAGLCLLITDQSWTPFHLYVRAGPRDDALARLDCRLGQSGGGAGAMRRVPFHSTGLSKLLFAVGEHPNSIEWVYTSTQTSEPAA